MLAKGCKLGSLYVLECHGEVGVAMVVVDNGLDLWNKMLGHMSQKGLEVMLRRDQLPSLNSIDLEFCEHCLHGKQRGINFVKIGHDKKNITLGACAF